MKKITIWCKLEENGFEHNHVEDGWIEGYLPSYAWTISKGWANANSWLKYWAYQDGLKLVEKTLQID